MSRIVVDSSAVVAALLEEPGGEEMARRDGPFLISTVNLCEVLERLAVGSAAEAPTLAMLEDLGLVLVDFTPDLAAIAARLKASTRSEGNPIVSVSPQPWSSSLSAMIPLMTGSMSLKSAVESDVSVTSS